MRKPVIAGNWKMYKKAGEAAAFVQHATPLVSASRNCEIVICPPYLSISEAVAAAAGTNIEVGGQDLFWLREGAYTGEVSAPMLQSAGCKWVIVGHSERRQYFHETDENVLKKTQAAIDAGLTPIVCVGERLDEREAGQTEAVLAAQFAGGLAPLVPKDFARVVIAYEPVWAIGTGKTATPEMAEAAHAFIRAEISRAIGDEAADACRILYGGSVKPENIKGLMAQSNIDGALVGGASLDPLSFAAIVNY